MTALKMLKRPFYRTLGISGLTLGSLGLALSLSAVAVESTVDGTHEYGALKNAEQWEFFNQYCTDCHNFEDYFGGVDFTSLFPEDVPANAELFEKTVRKVRAHMMPPPGKNKPSDKTAEQFVTWLESYLDEAATQRDPVHPQAIHRLNRKEYANAIRDLLGMDINPADILPEDDTSDGFDNIAEALQVSPAFIDQYVSAARNVIEQAVGDKSPGLGSTVYNAPETLPMRGIGGGSQQFHIDGLPLGTRGGMLIDHWFPADGEYAVSIGDFPLFAWMYNIEFENKMIVTIDGEKVFETIVGGPKDLEAIDKDQGDALQAFNARTKNIHFETTAGPKKVGVTFVRRTFAESDDRLQSFIPGTVQDRILSVPSVEVRGPFHLQKESEGISQTPTRKRIFSCYPQNAAEQADCAEQIITSFATRAYRGPLTEVDKKPLFAFYQAGVAKGGFEEGIRSALTRALASPKFLYRYENIPQNLEPGSNYPISSLDLASRLSFFLWSSIPDDELLKVAMEDKLRDPAVLQAQVKRMLADPKSQALASNFAYQWLGLKKLDEINPDEAIFPYASGAGDLRPDFKKEIELFVDSVFREDRSILELLDADYSYLNERLALHYGIEEVRGNRFRRVALHDSARWGLLGKGGVLMVSAYPNRTSPVLRGAWVLERIMGTPPPVPPPNVEDLPENEAGQVAMTVRERLQIHRENPSCNSCHAVIDPLGFALDNFDAVGKWRDLDRFARTKIDASGVLPNGKPVNGPDDLRTALMANPDMFVLAFTEKLLTYAQGRTVELEETPTVRNIARAAAKDDYRFSSLVMNIVNTPSFQMSKVPKQSLESPVASREIRQQTNDLSSR